MYVRGGAWNSESILFAILCDSYRFGNIGSLSVKEMSATQKPSTKTSKSPGTAKVLDINNSTLMFVGGLGGQIKVTFGMFICTGLIAFICI